MSRVIIWGFVSLAWLAFAFWYTNTGGPLTDEEIETYITRFAQSNDRMKVEQVRTFLASDTGNQFIMVNKIDMVDNPPVVRDAAPGESAESLMGRYME